MVYRITPLLPPHVRIQAFRHVEVHEHAHAPYLLH